MEERKPFFVAVKFVNASGVDKSLKSDDIYVVDEVRLKYWCFHPRHLNDFDNEEYKYGVIKNEEMVYLKVVRLAENYDDLGYGRISIPKRWSIGKGSEPLKSFRFVAEGEAGKKAADASKRSHQVLREESHSEKKNHSEKRKSEHDKNKKKHKRRRKSHHRSQKSPDEKGNANAFNSSLRDDNSHDEDAFSDNNANGIKEDNPICSSEDKPSSSAANDPPVCDQCLKHRAEAEKAREEIKQLQEELKKLRSESGTISKIEVMELLQANLKGTSVTEEKFLENVKYLVDDSANVEVPDGMVYCGNKIIVNKSDLYETSRAPTFGRRVARIIDIFYPGEQHQHFLSGFAARAPATLEIFKITDHEVRAIKKILKALPGWNAMPKSDISTANICSSIKYYTSQCLTNFLKGNGHIRHSTPKPKKGRTTRRSSSSGFSSTSEEEN